ncbi:MAG TPA: metallopeptidase TldD-related protein [Polyangia bacterium]|nr:metallopeptidase TldD-related protein [Polyangia bacterium]
MSFRLRRATWVMVVVGTSGCAASPGAPAGNAADVRFEGAPARPPLVVRVDPLSGGGAARPAGLTALEAELRRGMGALATKGSPPPYFIEYEVYDKTETVISASHGSLVQSSSRRARILDTDVRVGDYALDSTHTMRSNDFDFSSMSMMGGHPVALPLEDDEPTLRTIAWGETDRRYKDAAERFVKIVAQKSLKVAEEDPSDDFSKEKPATYVGARAEIAVDVPTWEKRIRDLSARFRGRAEILDSQVTLQVVSSTRWTLDSAGGVVQTGRNYVRVFVEAGARADDGMELQRFESYDAASFEGLAKMAEMERGTDAVIADLEALRRAPLADPYIGPAILEGRAAGVFFHEIFGHRVEGHRQKNDDEGQTFAKKIGEPIMPSFISVYDDPTMERIGDTDLNGFYRFDDEGVVGQRATLVDGGVLKNFLLSRSPTRGFNHSNGHGRRQEGRTVVARQGNLVVEPKVAVPFEDLRRRLRDEAKRQGKPYGLLFRDISGGFTNTTRGGPQAFKVLPILVYRVWVDGRPDELVRGVDLVGTPLAALTHIIAASDDYQTFNGYCGAESGFVPVSATSPSLLVEQIESERRDKGSDKPPVLPPPPSTPSAPASGAKGGAK